MLQCIIGVRKGAKMISVNLELVEDYYQDLLSNDWTNKQINNKLHYLKRTNKLECWLAFKCAHSMLVIHHEND